MPETYKLIQALPLNPVRAVVLVCRFQIRLSLFPGQRTASEPNSNQLREALLYKTTKYNPSPARTHKLMIYISITYYPGVI